MGALGLDRSPRLLRLAADGAELGRSAARACIFARLAARAPAAGGCGRLIRPGTLPEAFGHRRRPSRRVVEEQDAGLAPGDSRPLALSLACHIRSQP